MLTKHVVDFFGTKAAAARALGITKGAISNWDDIVPQTSVWRVEQATNGRLKPDMEFYRKLAEKQQRRRAKAARARYRKG